MSADVSVRVPVLVVEDDDANREALRLVVSEGGYPVVEAATAQEALAYLRAAPSAHVVVLDYVLPGANGDAVLRASEQEPELRRHCYVLVSAGAVKRLTGDEQRLIAVACTEALAKPFDMDELLRAVASAAEHLPPTPEP